MSNAADSNAYFSIHLDDKNTIGF